MLLSAISRRSRGLYKWTDYNYKLCILVEAVDFDGKVFFLIIFCLTRKFLVKTMDISNLQFNSSKYTSKPHQMDKASKPHSKAEINKALSLLGFNSWSQIEPSKKKFESFYLILI